MADSQSQSDSPPVSVVKYEYLDHTADVQLHAWGSSLEESIEQLCVSMYGYMTEEIGSVEPVYSMDFTASGADLSSMIFNLLDECLYGFTTEPFFIGRVARVIGLDHEKFEVKVRAWGDSFDKERHPPGTEVKGDHLLEHASESRR
ncbi:archease [Aphelenchoides avenae]|nr:archease [Aphelenchus avenae]